MSSVLEQIKKYTAIVADTGDFESALELSFLADSFAY